MTTENHTEQQVPNEMQSGRLLSAEQKAICEQIAVGETLNSRRAQALLVVDGGATQAEAGRQVGLTLYQVKYCLSRFRQLGMAMFPDTVSSATQPDPVLAPEPVSEPEPPIDKGEAMIIAEKADKKSDDKPPKVKKRKKKSKKKNAKKKKGGKSKSRSGKSSKKKNAKKTKKKSKKSRKDKGRKKSRKSKSGKSSGKKGKKKDKRK